MQRPQAFFQHRQRPSLQFLRLTGFALLIEHGRKIVQGGRHRRMLRPQGLFLDGEGATIQTLHFAQGLNPLP